MFWIVRAQSVGEGEPGDWSVSVPCTGAFQVLNLSHWQQVANAPSIDAHANVELTVSLVSEAAGDLDTFYDQTGWTWNPTDNLAMVIQSQATAQGGFTEQDRTTIQTTQTTTEETNQLSLAINAAVQVPLELAGQAVTLTVGQILTSNLLDALTTLDLSGGITCAPIRYDASLNHLYGVQLLVSSVPEGWRFQTPDNAWGFHDLAVITVVRGNAQLERHGIHALSHTIYPLPGLPFPWAVNLDLPLQPPDYHINVDWAEGVCGQLIGLGLP